MVGCVLLLCGPSACRDMASKPKLPEDCYMIHQSRAKLSAKDRLETLEVNFTEIAENYVDLYVELEAIRIHNFPYQNNTWVSINCTLVDMCKTSKSVDDIIAIQLPDSIEFLTNVLKLDENTIVAFLFRNRSSVIINKRDFHVLPWTISTFIYILHHLVGCGYIKKRKILY